MKETQDSSVFVLLILSLAQLFGLSLWFVINAVIDQLVVEFTLSESSVSSMSIVVTLGFVIGGLISALTNISDIISTKFVFTASSLLGALTTFLVTVTPNITLILFLRFLTGLFLAGIYPVGMKMTASHYKFKRGLAIGVLLSALTIGSGLPYIFLIFGTPHWKVVVYIVVALSTAGGILVWLFINSGPFIGNKTTFSLSAAKTIFQQKSVFYATLGYLGHMWELYAYWVWFPRMLKESLERSGEYSQSGVIQIFAFGSFLIFFAGGLANIFGGLIADRFGRTKFNIFVLSISGTSGLIIGFFFSQPYALLFVGVIWGITIIPDSPQYSTIITEVCDQSLVGSALAIQTAIGFLLTIISISLVPIMVAEYSWNYAFMFLSIGPIVGIIAMLLLRREDDAIKIALGKM